MAEPPSTKPQQAADERQPVGQRWLEIAAIFFLFLLYVGPLTPEVNEAHYLAKARHYWNPDFAPADHFLNSGDAHGVFYWSFGWITTLVSLPVAVWIGRIICWFGIALAWHRLAWLLLPKPWSSVLLVALGLAGIHYTHMAGEWLIGGVEAKCFAYALAFWGLGDALLGRWNRAWIWLGAASGFHVLVGGWMVVCLMFGWLICPGHRPRLMAMLPGLFVGGAISLIGVVPLLILNWGVDSLHSGWASYVYVFERLSHHLVVHSFLAPLKIRFAVTAFAWGATAYLLRDVPRARILNGVVAGSMVLVLLGIAIDQFFIYWRTDYVTSAKLLRLYWFRLADVMVPLALAINLGLLVMRYRRNFPRLTKTSLIVAGLLVGVGLGVRFEERWTATVAPADLSSQVTSPAAWEAVGKWIKTNTPTDAVFLTPRLQSTFKWYAQRAEVVTSKDVPQDDMSLLEWRERRVDIHWRPYHQRASLSLAALTEADIRELAEEYGFQYVVVDSVLARRDRLQPDWSFPRVYPADAAAEADYEVYEIVP